MQALTAHSGGRERNAAVLPLPAFTDNYIWAIVRDGQAAVVDPGEAGPVLRLLEQQRPETARHSTHAPSRRPRRRRIRIVLASEGILPYTVRRANGRRAADAKPLVEGDRVSISELDLDLRVLTRSVDTAGHIAHTGRAAGLNPFCSVATPCLRGAVAVFSKALRRKCMIL